MENEDPAAPLGVLSSGVYPATFGLLAEWGLEARLVREPLAPGALAGVRLLIVPSGGLRGRGASAPLRQALAAYVALGPEQV